MNIANGYYYEQYPSPFSFFLDFHTNCRWQGLPEESPFIKKKICDFIGSKIGFRATREKNA